MNETTLTYTYRFYARRTPGDLKPSVWCGDIAGPNVYKVCNHPLMLTAKVHAWWRNRSRVEMNPLLEEARSILRGTGGDRSDRDTLKALWHLLLPAECGENASEERVRV